MNKRTKFAIMALAGAVVAGSVLTMLSGEGIAASEADSIAAMPGNGEAAASDAEIGIQPYGTVFGDIKVTQHVDAGAFGSSKSGATITVSGTASQAVEPDTLLMSLGVHTASDSAQEALQANTELMDSAISALMDAGVTEDEIQTDRFTIYPDYNSYESDGTWTSKLTGFNADNSITVRTGMTDSAGMLIDTAVEAGANKIGFIQFELSEQERQRINDELFASALQNAEDRANSILKSYNYTTSGIKSISTSEFGINSGYEVFVDHDRAVLQSSPPIYQSDQAVTAKAHVTYFIEEMSP